MTNLPLSLAVSAVAGALTLLRPADWSPRTRRAYVLGPGLLAAAVVVVAFSRSDRTQPADSPDAAAAASVTGAGAEADGGPGAEGARSGPRLVIGCTVLAAGVGAAVSGAQALSLKMDTAMEHWLADRGVAAPRLWMAAAVTLASLAADLPGDRDGRAVTAPVPPPPAA